MRHQSVALACTPLNVICASHRTCDWSNGILLHACKHPTDLFVQVTESVAPDAASVLYTGPDQSQDEALQGLQDSRRRDTGLEIPAQWVHNHCSGSTQQTASGSG